MASAAQGAAGPRPQARPVRPRGRVPSTPTRIGLAVCAGLALLLHSHAPAAGDLPPGALGWHEADVAAIRGITIGPIESALHPNRGYGSPLSARAMREARRMGANWVSLTPFGRVWGLRPSGISMVFEAEFANNREAVMQAMRQAHAEGLRVLVIPQLWVESGGWRGEIDPGTHDGWQRWSDAYRGFILEWARVAAEGAAEMFSVGVELRSWATTTHASSLSRIIREVRQVYPGLITYAANWDDVEETVILGELDLIGVNAFYPLAEQQGALLPELVDGARQAVRRAERLAQMWDKPVIFTEFGYSSRPDPALRPWEWPEHVTDVTPNELAQAHAYHALLCSALDRPWFAGLFTWRMYADPDDVSQEPEWGFSPRGKLAELVLRDAFGAWMAADGPRPLGTGLYRLAAQRVGVY